jgi:hypothetical protein
MGTARVVAKEAEDSAQAALNKAVRPAEAPGVQHGGPVQPDVGQLCHRRGLTEPCSNNKPLSTRSQVGEVQFAAMLKYNLHLQATIGTLTGQVGAAQTAAAAANVAAANAQAVAQAAENADSFRPAAPPKYGNKKKDTDVKQWIPIIKDYLCITLDADYIRLASFYLEGGLRSLWTSLYEAYNAANGDAP